MNENIRITIKKQTKKENKTTLVLLTVILFALTILLNTIITLITKNFYNINSIYIDIIISTITSIILAPITLNYMNMYLKKAKNEEINIKTLFQKPSKKYTILYTIISIAYLIIYFLLSKIPLIGTILNIIILITIIPIFFYLPLVYLGNKSLKIKEIFIKTIDLISGRRVQIYAMIISYIGLIILSLLTFGILFIYTVPCIYLSLTHLYLYYTNEKEYKKEKGLKDGYILIIFIIILAFTLTCLFIKYPTTLSTVKTNLLGNYETGEKLYYGNQSININVPEDYKMSSTSSVSKTYTNKENILQYSIYLQTTKEAIQMDKEIVKEKKQTNPNIKDEEFTITHKNKKIKCYMYGENEKTIVAYIKKDNLITAISLTGKNIKKNDIKKFININ